LIDYQQVEKLFHSLIEKNNSIDLSKGVLGGKEGEVFEDTKYLTECILDKFGLPHSLKYSKNIAKVKRIEQIQNCIETLKTDASEYLNSKPLYDYKLLENAIDSNQSAESIFAELKIANHIYTIFVYDEILLKRKDSISNVLKEYDILKDNNELLNDLGVLSFTSENSLREKLNEKIKNSDLNFYDNYLEYQKTLRK